MTDVLNTIYCPACAQKVEHNGQIAPGSFEWTCPACDTEFRVNIQFFPVEKEIPKDKMNRKVMRVENDHRTN